MAEPLVTSRITPDALQVVGMAAAKTGEKQDEGRRRLLEAEMKKSVPDSRALLMPVLTCKDRLFPNSTQAVALTDMLGSFCDRSGQPRLIFHKTGSHFARNKREYTGLWIVIRE